MKKRGVSPVIATVLLIALVILIALIIFFWFKGMQAEAITKFGGKNIELVCDDISFEADLTANILSIVNNGNVPIYNIKIKIYNDGSHSTISLKEEYTEKWDAGINSGGTFTQDISGKISPNTNKIVLIPELLGESERGRRPFECGEDKNGLSISL